MSKRADFKKCVSVEISLFDTCTGFRQTIEVFNLSSGICAKYCFQKAHAKAWERTTDITKNKGGLFLAWYSDMDLKVLIILWFLFELIKTICKIFLFHGFI